MLRRTLSPVAVLALILVACGGGAEGEGGATASTENDVEGAAVESTSAVSAEDLARGAQVYQQAACFSCHGMNGKGAIAGPELENIAEHWNREDLASFVANPASWELRKERVATLAAQYPTKMARPMREISEEDRLLLADWLLTL